MGKQAKRKLDRQSKKLQENIEDVKKLTPIQCKNLLVRESFATISERNSASLFIALIHQLGIPAAPQNKYTDSMVGAIAAGIRKEWAVFENLLTHIPPSFTSQISAESRVQWCREVVSTVHELK